MNLNDFNFKSLSAVWINRSKYVFSLAICGFIFCSLAVWFAYPLFFFKIGNRGIDFEVYGKPLIQYHVNALSIKADQKGGGLYIRYQNNEIGKQVLSLVGRQSGKPANMQVSLDDRPPSFSPAPDGEWTVTLEKGQRVSLLVYEHKRFDYVIKRVAVRSCGDCMGGSELKGLIKAKNPNLDRLLSQGEWMKVLLILLRWSANKVDWGYTHRSDMGDAYTSHDQTFLFDHDRLEGSCGLYADYFVKIAREFGFDAFTLNFGIPTGNVLTHVIAIVRGPDGKFYSFDPFLNVITQAPSGDILSFDKFLQLPQAGLKEFPASRDVVFKTDEKTLRFFKNYFDENGYAFSRCEEKKIGRGSYMTCPNIPFSGGLLIAAWRDSLIANHIDPKINIYKGLLRKGWVLNVGGAAPASRNEFIDLLNRNGLQFQGAAA